MYRVLWALQITLEHQNCGQYLMKTAIKRENDEFLVMSLKHVPGLMGRANRLGTPKLWEIPHENGHETKKYRVFGHKSQKCIVSLRAMKIPMEPQNCRQ